MADTTQPTPKDNPTAPAVQAAPSTGAAGKEPDDTALVKHICCELRRTCEYALPLEQSKLEELVKEELPRAKSFDEDRGLERVAWKLQQHFIQEPQPLSYDEIAKHMGSEIRRRIYEIVAEQQRHQAAAAPAPVPEAPGAGKQKLSRKAARVWAHIEKQVAVPTQDSVVIDLCMGKDTVNKAYKELPNGVYGLLQVQRLEKRRWKNQPD
jgi:hypothetical protein